MRIHEFIKEIEEYYGRYDENIIPYIIGYLNIEFRENQLNELQAWTLKTHPRRYGTPDISAFHKAWWVRGENKKGEGIKSFEQEETIDPRKPSDEPIVNDVLEKLNSKLKWRKPKKK
jgi:hypothetical protein